MNTRVAVSARALTTQLLLPAVFWALLPAAALVLLGVLLSHPDANQAPKLPLLHFLITTAVALLAFLAALLAGRAAIQLQDTRVLFLTLGLMSIGGLIAEHGLSTPGVLIDSQEQGSLSGLTAFLSLFFGALFFALSAVQWGAGARRALGRHAGLWLLGTTLALIAVDLLAFRLHAFFDRLPLSYAPLSWAVAVPTLLLLGFATARYVNSYRLTRMPMLWALVLGLLLLIASQLAMVLSPKWTWSWWEYHVTMLVGFVAILGGPVFEYRRGRSPGLMLAELTARLVAARATLESVMASMSDGLVVLDSTGAIRYCNAQAGEMLATDPQALIGRPAQAAFAAVRPALMDPEDVQVAWERALVRREEKPSFELCLAGPPQRDVVAQLFPVTDDAGARVGTGAVLRDVTAERDLQRTKDELVSVVSHEVRTPLASLVGFAELLLTRDYPDAQRRRYLTVMVEEGRRLTALINNFLDLQRLESGGQMMKPVPTDLRPVLEQAVAAAGEDPACPITLDVPDRLPMVQADADRVLQVLVNLLSNARKYSPDGGEVHVSARVAGGQVEIAVRDWGLGLPPEAMAQLFDKFYRVDNTDRRAIRGTGLGLAICKQIVEAHGGRIWAESAGLRQGSRFCFALPLAEPGAARGDVLVVEDDAGFAQLLEAELAAKGLTAVRAGSAEAALEQVTVARPRAVVLDLLLPGLQGEGFLARLRETEELKTPVVVVSVKDLSPEERVTLEACGAVAVIQKGPDAAARAAEAVVRALARQPARKEAHTG